MPNPSYHENRRSPWCATFHLAGKRSRKFFTTEAAAKNFLRAVNRKKKEEGVNALFFSPAERSDYINALNMAKVNGYEQLYPFVVALLNRTSAESPKKKSDVSIQKAFEEYYVVKSNQGRSKSTLHDIHVRIGKFAKDFLGATFGDITQKHIEDWCIKGKIAPRSQRNNFTAVASFLRWAKRAGYHDLPLDFDRHAFLPRELKKQKPVFSLGEVERILDILQREPTFRRYIPFYALQLFCGIRRAEAERMRWEYIDVANKTIRLPAEITKTGDEHFMRAPFLPDTVFRWLAPFVPTTTTATIHVPTNHARRLIDKKIGKWERNGMRHTFATMHVSLHGDPAKTAVLLRHRNQQRLWQNYLARLVPEEDAKKYFALSPRPF